MATDQPESDATLPAEATDPATAENPPVPPDPRELIDRLIAAGEWPEPALIEQIIAAGESALGPLLDFMRTYPDPKDYRREIVLYHGIGILGEIRSPGTIPDLVEILRRYPGESGAQAADVLGDFGPAALEPILEVVRDPSVSARVRRNAIDAAKVAAGADPASRSQLGDMLRPLLADALDRTREMVKSQEGEPGEEGDEDSEGWIVEGVDDEDVVADEDLDESEEARAAAYEKGPDAPAEEEDYGPDEELMFLVIDMADLADPRARDLVDAAFREDLVDTFWVDKRSVDESYREGGEPPRSGRDWLEDYREQYRRHLDPPRLPPIKMEPLYQSSVAHPREVAEPAEPPRQEPVRNTGPKLGRNDPCWCGSGKKYKKCHWGKPGP